MSYSSRLEWFSVAKCHNQRITLLHHVSSSYHHRKHIESICNWTINRRFLRKCFIYMFNGVRLMRTGQAKEASQGHLSTAHVRPQPHHRSSTQRGVRPVRWSHFLECGPLASGSEVDRIGQVVMLLQDVCLSPRNPPQ